MCLLLFLLSPSVFHPNIKILQNFILYFHSRWKFRVSVWQKFCEHIWYVDECLSYMMKELILKLVFLSSTEWIKWLFLLTNQSCCSCLASCCFLIGQFIITFPVHIGLLFCFLLRIVAQVNIYYNQKYLQGKEKI